MCCVCNLLNHLSLSEKISFALNHFSSGTKIPRVVCSHDVGHSVFSLVLCNLVMEAKVLNKLVELWREQEACGMCCPVCVEGIHSMHLWKQTESSCSFTKTDPVSL